MARQADLLALGEARARILQRFSRLEPETVHLCEMSGRVLATDARAPFDLPPFANSSMDGFAVESRATGDATGARPARLRVVSHIAAGAPSVTTIAGDRCARIMTGAPLPPGADAVIPFEEVEDTGGAIVLSRPVRPGACVRPAGQDVMVGQTVLDAGTELRAPQIALLAALGFDRIDVIRRPRVAIIATGDELTAPGEPLSGGQIYNSNTPMLVAAVAEAGGLVSYSAAAGDDPEEIAAAIEAAGDVNLLLTSGGASVGDFDHVKAVVGGAGSLAFWRVRLRPGKPLLFGTIGSIPVIGLPGNPTSAMVTFEEFVRPAVRTMLGLEPMRPEIEVVVDESIDNRGGRRTFARVRLRYHEGRYHASLAGGQDSAMLLPLAHADGLLEIPEDREELAAGDTGTVQVWRLPGQEAAPGAATRI